MKTPPAIRRFIEEFLKIDEEAVGKGSVNRALQEAMREEGVSDPGVFEKRFVSSQEVRQRFVNAVVIGETWFCLLYPSDAAADLPCVVIGGPGLFEK